MVATTLCYVVPIRATASTTVSGSHLVASNLGHLVLLHLDAGGRFSIAVV